MNADDEVTKTLIRARRRITDPAHWTTHAAARDRAGLPALPRSRAAVAWCARGALEAETPWLGRRGGYALYCDCAGRLSAVSGNDTPETVNDERGHAAVLEMYDAAIRRK